MELWSKAHIKTLLPGIGIMILLSLILRVFLGKKPLKIRMIPIQIIACLLVLLEIGKQVTSFQNGYDLYHIPLHYCSLFLFTLPVMAFYRGRHHRTVFGLRRAIFATPVCGE